MHFSPHTLVWHLVRLGLFTTEDVVTGPVEIHRLAGRHHSYRVRCGTSPEVICKQPRSDSPEFVEAITREACFLRLVATTPPCSRLRPLLPRFLHFEPRRRLLTTACLPGRDLHAGDRDPDRAADHALRSAAASAAGRSLGQLHRLSRPAAAEFSADQVPRSLPWAISLDMNASTFFQALSSANLQLVAELRHDRTFLDALRANRDEWHADAIIHGDVKWSNLLCDEETSPPAVRLVDWESVSWGDPAWDLAGALHSYVLQSVQEDAFATPNAARTSFAPFCGELWRSYEREAPPADRDAFRRRVVRYSAARLVQSVLERQIQASRIDQVSRGLLAFSRAWSCAPLRSSFATLGLEP